MAILNHSESQIEVKIKRDPDNAYFDELVKVGDREKPDAQTCHRYIVGQPGETFTIEITIKKGYVFGNAIKLKAVLHFSSKRNRVSCSDVQRPKDHSEGTKQDIKTRLKGADAIVGQRLHFGGHFSFSSLEVDEELADDNKVAELTPQNLGGFCVSIKRVTEVRKMTSVEYQKRLRRACEEAKKLHGQTLHWEANKVDPHSYKALGITSGISLAGANSKPMLPFTHAYASEAHTDLLFHFHCRNSEFLEQLSIVKYPPALYCYAWRLLSVEERKLALKELQEINKDHVHKDMEAKAGQILPKPGKTNHRDDAKEWRAWRMMYAWEREAAFETLQQARKYYERKEVQRQIQERGKGAVLDLDLDDVEEKKDLKVVESVECREALRSITSTQASTKKRPSSESSTKTPIGSTDAEALTGAQVNTSTDVNGSEMNDDSIRSSQPTQVTIKREIIDLESLSPPTKRVGIATTPRVEVEIDDAELQRLEAEERKLLEEIEEAERLAKLKRKQEALHAKIEAAKALKAGRKS